MAPPGDGEARTLNEESLKIRAEQRETGRKEPGELLFPICSGTPALEPQDERDLCLLPEMTVRSLSAEKPSVSKMSVSSVKGHVELVGSGYSSTDTGYPGATETLPLRPESEKCTCKVSGCLFL